jgi:hypothetical protein
MQRKEDGRAKMKAPELALGETNATLAAEGEGGREVA